MRRVVSEVRVRYPEVDRMGVVHHTHYLIWFEIGRTELMRAAGCSYRELEERGLLFPVIRLGSRYHAPARYDETISVETRLAEVARLVVRFEYRILRSGSDLLLVEGFTEHAAVDRELRACRLPRDISLQLESWRSGDES